MTALESLAAKLQRKLLDAEKSKVRSDATEVSSPLLREGQILVTKTKNKAVVNILKDAKNRYDAILSLTDDQQVSDDKDIMAVNKNLEHVSNWLLNICEEFINIHKNMGTTNNIASEFQKDHEQLFEELNNISKEITNLRSTVSRFSRKKKKQVLEITEKLDGIQSKSVTITSRVKYRIVLVKMFISFLDHSDEVSIYVC